MKPSTRNPTRHLGLLVTVAALIGPLPLRAAAVTPDAALAAAPAAHAPVLLKAPDAWIHFEDASWTPVLDDVSRALAEARDALARQDRVHAAESLHAAALALQAPAAAAERIARLHAAADGAVAQDTRTRLLALAVRLDAAADRAQAGQLNSLAALDKTLDKNARSDLERRWQVTDIEHWYPVSQEPERHFDAASIDFTRKEPASAAIEVRKAAAFVRLEAARAEGPVRQALEAAEVRLEATAAALEHNALLRARAMDQAFAAASHALALAHRAHAAAFWAQKAYDDAGYELQAAAEGLQSAAAWSGGRAKAAAEVGSTDARDIGDKLASGGLWARYEVSRGFDSLGDALDQLGRDIGAKTRASPFDFGT
jgi:hypothetical protein